MTYVKNYVRLSCEKESNAPPCSSAELFFAEKIGVHRGKISVVDMVSWFL